jgi:magnesium transporter
MLTLCPSAARDLDGAVWVDLLDPTPAERQVVEGRLGSDLPSRSDIESIESSRRVHARGRALYLSTPVLTGDDCVNDALVHVGIVLTRDGLVTLRFGQVRALETTLRQFAGHAEMTAGEAFIGLLDALTDHAADALERASAELDSLSRAAFRAERPRTSHTETSRELQGALRELGRMSDGISHLRDSLLGLVRICAFVHEAARTEPFVATPSRLEALRTDLGSLNDHQAHLANKVQFLLDATLGFINIQQNEIVKTLTVVSVVGVPPVLIAGIYGMNFRVMPELEWPLGYPFALGLIVLSGLVPLAWLKWRGWM